MESLNYNKEIIDNSSCGKVDPPPPNELITNTVIGTKSISILSVLIIVSINCILASVIIPSYNNYLKVSKEKVALNFAATVAQSAATYYSQSQVYPMLSDLNIRAPEGFTSYITAENAVVSGDGTAGYVTPGDLETQFVNWKNLCSTKKILTTDKYLTVIKTDTTDHFVFIPQGSFTMGAQTNAEDSIHNVTISNAFYIGKNLITQAEWNQYMSFIYPGGPGGIYRISEQFGLGDNYPIYCVNWFSTLIYCNKRSIAEGLTPCYSVNDTTDTNQWPMNYQWDEKFDITGEGWNSIECNWEADGYRLPTEAEWEYVARYNDQRTYPWGNTEPVEGISNYGGFTNKTSLVGSYPDSNSKLGICDMAGNTWEWCWDWYEPYSSTSKTDPKGPSDGDWRVLRGGGWLYVYSDIMSSYRNMNSPEQLFEGFRVVRKADEPVIWNVSPSDGMVLSHNTQYNITWGDNIIEKVKIELVRSDTLIVAVIADSTESDGSFQWTVPNSFTGQDFKVRISSVIDNQIQSISESCFAIIPGKIMVLSPNGGEKIIIDSIQEITWLDNLSENVKIELLENDTFNSIIANSTPSSGSFLWNVPESLSGDNFKIKVSSVLLPTLYKDTSDSLFTVNAGEIIVTSPNGGETLNRGNEFDITWFDNINQAVKIVLLKSDTLYFAITDSTESDGSYLWTTPLYFIGSDYKIKVTSINNGSVTDSSDTSFSFNEGSISILSPTENEVLEIYENYEINWSDDLTEDVTISLFKDTLLVENFVVPSTGSFTWNFWNSDIVAGSDYKIRVESTLLDIVYAETGYFSIKGTNNVNGGVSGVWTDTNSPYIITDSTYVSSLNSLTIEKNVKVKGINQSNSFAIEGKLLSLGNQIDIISFTDIKLLFNNSTSADSSKIIYTMLDRTVQTKAAYSSITVSNNSKAIIQNCILKNSDSFAIEIINSDPIISNCLVVGNENGVSFKNSSTSYFINNTICNNQGGLYFDGNSDPMITNNIVYDNSIYQVNLNSDDSDPEFYYNNIQGGQPNFILGSGVTFSGSYSSNINSDPLFVPDSYMINSNSPCFDTGYPDMTQEILGYLYIPSKDILGKNRLYGDIDIGCYEYWPSGTIPEIPSNILVSSNDEIINLSWDECDNAISYQIYSSDEPYGVFDLISITGSNNWQAPVSSTKKFYYIVASSGDLKFTDIKPSKIVRKKNKIKKIEDMLR
jgi:formylglycine-generating enzyme